MGETKNEIPIFEKHRSNMQFSLNLYYKLEYAYFYQTKLTLKSIHIIAS